MKKYVIIGNGTAAVGCIEGIRSIDREGAITVVSEEKHHVYCRPLISYYLEKKTDLERIKYRPDDFYEKNACTVIYGKCAESIDPAKKEVMLDDGQTLPYDALCVATGSTPFVPPTEGLDTVSEKYTFLTLDDALSLEKSVGADKRVFIVGAGLIGLKCAEGLCGRVKSITVCDLSDRVLSSILDGESAAIVKKHLEENGISFMLSDSAERFVGNVAEMKSGVEVPFDILVCAVGVRANTALVRDIGGKCTRGIEIDKYMKTSIHDIYAAGDCTETRDISDGKVKVMAILPNAYIEGNTVGINMAGGNKVFDCAVPMNSIGFFGLHIMTAGCRGEVSDGFEVYEEKTEKTLKKLYIKDGLVVGFVLVGNTERAGIYTSIIRQRTPIDSVNFNNLKKNPNLSVFDAEYRRKNLKGVV